MIRVRLLAAAFAALLGTIIALALPLPRSQATAAVAAPISTKAYVCPGADRASSASVTAFLNHRA